MEKNLEIPEGPVMLYYIIHKTDEEKSLPRIPWPKEEYETFTEHVGSSSYEEYVKRLEENKDGEFDFKLETVIVNLGNPNEATVESLKKVLANPLFHKWIGDKQVAPLINAIINKQ